MAKGNQEAGYTEHGTISSKIDLPVDETIPVSQVMLDFWYILWIMRNQGGRN